MENYLLNMFEFENKNINILIIENSSSVLKIIDTILKENDFNTFLATSLKQAREEMTLPRIDYVILDINLCENYDYQITEELLKLNSKIIILCSQTDFQIKEIFYQKGVVDFINKDKNFIYKISEIPNLIAQLEKNKFKTILIVNDSSIVEKQLKNILENRNYNILENSNINDILNIVNEKKIDLILLHLERQNSDSYDFLIKNKKIIFDKLKVNVAIVTENISSNVFRDYSRIGVKEIIKKPYIIEELILKIDILINYKDTKDECFYKTQLITQIENSIEHLKKQYHLSENNLAEIIHFSKQYENAMNVSNIILRVNKEEIITYANKKFYEISGFTKEELIGKHYDFIERSYPLPKENPKIKECLISGKIWKGQLINTFKNGKTYVFKVTVIPITNLKGEIVEYLSVRKNITDVIELHQEIEETQREIIYKMGEIGESRSNETGNHVKRVAEYSKLLAKLYGLEEAECDILFTASPMHDIGKVGIPDYILHKTAKFTSEEFEIMKTHTMVGYEILKNSKREILKAAAIVARDHHEKWDGSGYPKGSKAEEIHIYGRITAIADVFDALGSDRCYKKAWSEEDIFKLLKNEKGKHFDPVLIDLFFENVDKFRKIRNSYKD